MVPKTYKKHNTIKTSKYNLKRIMSIRFDNKVASAQLQLEVPSGGELGIVSVTCYIFLKLKFSGLFANLNSLDTSTVKSHMSAF